MESYYKRSKLNTSKSDISTGVFYFLKPRAKFWKATNATWKQPFSDTKIFFFKFQLKGVSICLWMGESISDLRQNFFTWGLKNMIKYYIAWNRELDVSEHKSQTHTKIKSSNLTHHIEHLHVNTDYGCQKCNLQVPNS